MTRGDLAARSCRAAFGARPVGRPVTGDRIRIRVAGAKPGDFRQYVYYALRGRSLTGLSGRPRKSGLILIEPAMIRRGD
jgi:hypothetical protein